MKDGGPAPGSPASDAAGRRFAVALALVVLAAVALRAYGLGERGLDHFDEGVYAFSARGVFDAEHDVWPRQVLFSPPAYYSLGAVVSALAGLAADRALLWVSLVVGALGVALIGLVARAWFGGAAGIAAAVLLAGSNLHVLLSQSALTDVLFATAHLGALAALVLALRRESATLAVPAGLLVGLAWNTKYHGWLALAVAGLAIGPRLVRALLARDRAGLRPLATWGIAALVAALCYLPWALHVQAGPGGYAALAEYQTGMLRPGWLRNAWIQLDFQNYLQTPWGRAAPALAALAAGWVARGGAGLRGALGAAGLLAIAGAVAGEAAVGAALAVTGIVASAWVARRGGGAVPLATFTLLVWLAVWLLLTPMYRPYARLLLPTTFAFCLGAGPAIRWLCERPALGGSRGLALSAFGLAALAGAALFVPHPARPFLATDGAARAAARIAGAVPEGARVLVLGEPAVAWYLEREGLRASEDVTGPELAAALDGSREPAFVVTGHYAQYTRLHDDILPGFGARLTELDACAFVPGDLRLLDDHEPRRARRLRDAGHEYALRLFRIDPEP